MKFLFLLLLCFNYNFVKISLLMTFICISISLKTSNIFENAEQLLYIMIFIIMNLEFK